VTNSTCVANEPSVLCPPFTVDALLNPNWMETWCNTAGSGIEMDWFGFFYQLSNKTADRWSPGTFWNVFYTECPDRSHGQGKAMGSRRGTCFRCTRV